MYFTVTKSRYIEDYQIELTFKNGKKGLIDFRDYVKFGGVFKRFKDLTYFKKAYVDRDAGTLCWPGGVDVAPETLYHEATGEPLPDWLIPGPQEKKKEKRRKAV